MDVIFLANQYQQKMLGFRNETFFNVDFLFIQPKIKSHSDSEHDDGVFLDFKNNLNTVYVYLLCI